MRCRMVAAAQLAPYQSPTYQAIAYAEAKEGSLARKSGEELLLDLQRKAATIGLQVTITRLPRPKLTVVEGSKQEDNGSAP